MEKSKLLQLLEGSGQEHILDDYDLLSPEQKSKLTHQIAHSGLKFSHLNTVLRESIAALDGGSNAAAQEQPKCVEPPPRDCLFSVATTKQSSPESITRLERIGLEAIAKGQTAILLLSGGSGTRLQISIPKGLFTCELLRERKSLFQFHCEKVLRVQQLSVAESVSRESHAGERQGFQKERATTVEPLIQVLVMVSEENSDETQRFFFENNWFGLKEEQVVFFVQSMLPCYDETTGKILMTSPYQMCLSPGGNGGVYQSLSRAPLFRRDNTGECFKGTGNDRATIEHSTPSKESVLDRLQRIGVRYVQIFSVDNLLAKIADPLFYGYAIDTKAHVVVKTTLKVSPEEKVGVFAKVNSEWGVIEYTELGSVRAGERDPQTGDLLYNCANIACHTCSVEFLACAAVHAETSVLYHAARKRIPTMNGPVMGVKLEAFIFDMFRYCRECSGNENGESFRIMQVDRGEEFAPIKNADVSPAATDTPTTAARRLLELHSGWAEKLLSEVDGAALGNATSKDLEDALALLRKGKRWVEVSPLVSYQGEGLAPYVEHLVESLTRGSEEIVLIDSSTTFQYNLSNEFAAAKI